MRAFLRILRSNSLTWWLLTITLSLITAFIVGNAVTTAQSNAARFGETTTVFVTTRSIATGETIRSDDVRKEALPKAFLTHATHAMNPVGRIARATMPQHTVIDEPMIANASQSAPTALLESDERGITVARGQDTATASYPYEIGDRVDVIATLTSRDEPAPANLPVVTVANNVRIIHVADTSVTIAVPMDHAETVAAATTSRQVTLAVRN